MMLLPSTVLLAFLMCGAYLRIARRRRILDIPNERSSHSHATPSGGGIPLMLAFVCGLVLAGWFHGVWENVYIMLSVAALSLAVLGFIDDLLSLSMRLRLLVYTLICVLVSVALIGPVFATGELVGRAWWVLAPLVLLWSLNLYNFMDGIDGFAALQAILACSAAAFLCRGSPAESGYALFCLLLAAVHGGFLIWNFPVARLFLGDAGSVPTGFLLGALALVGMLEGELNPLCWLVLLAVFITDATWTLLWRMLTRQPFMQPHRLHAYQRLSRLWKSHLRVDILLTLINLFWLLPLAFAVQAWPDHALIMVILAYLPLLCGMVKIRGLA